MKSVRNKPKSGISLIVLVITIIIMVILAASVIVSLKNNGIIGTTGTAVFKQNLANWKTELELYVGEATIEAKGKYDRENLNATMSLATYGNTPITDKNKDGVSNLIDVLGSIKKTKYENIIYVEKGQLVFKKNGLSKAEIELVQKAGYIVDGMPRITGVVTTTTMSSINLTVNLNMPEEVEKYVYTLNGTSEESDSYLKEYTGLEMDTEYTVKIEVKLKDGSSLTHEEKITTNGINGTITILPDLTELTDQDVNVELAYSEEIPEGYVLQYMLSEGMELDWTEYTEKIVITENTKITARLYNSEKDKSGAETEKIIQNIDKSDLRILLTREGEITATTSMKITAKVSGAIGGVKEIKYLAGEKTIADFKSSGSTPTKVTETEYTFNVAEGGWYTVYVKTGSGKETVSTMHTYYAYLYNQGDQCYGLTGGWTTTYKGGNSETHGWYKFEDRYMQLYTECVWWSYDLVTTNAIDLNGATKLYLDVEGTDFTDGRGHIYVGYKQNGTEKNLYTTTSPYNGILEIDISSINDQAVQIYVGVDNGGNIKVNKVWLDSNNLDVTLSSTENSTSNYTITANVTNKSGESITPKEIRYLEGKKEIADFASGAGTSLTKVSTGVYNLNVVGDGKCITVYTKAYSGEEQVSTAFTSLILYDKGNQYTDLTGGWTTEYRGGSGEDNGWYKFEDTYMQLYTERTWWSYDIITKNSINLNGSTKLYVDMESEAFTNSQGHIYVSYKQNGTYVNLYTSSSPYNGILEVDVSSISDQSVQICVCVDNGGNMKVNRMWLE